MQLEHFCLSCRNILADISLYGYVLVDCYNDTELKAFEIKAGEEYTVRGYDISIKSIDDSYELEVITIGHYMDDKIPKKD